MLETDPFLLGNGTMTKLRNQTTTFRIVKDCDLGLENAALSIIKTSVTVIIIRTSQPANNIYMNVFFEFVINSRFIVRLQVKVSLLYCI